MVPEIVVLVVLAAAFVVLKVIQGDVERKRRIERSERLLRDKAATGGFSLKKKWDEPEPVANDPEEENADTEGTIDENAVEEERGNEDESRIR